MDPTPLYRDWPPQWGRPVYHRRRRRPRRTLGGLLLLCGLVLSLTTVGTSLVSGPGNPTVHAPIERGVAAAPPPAADAPHGLPHEVPVSVSIPSIGVESRLEQVGLEADGALHVPDDEHVAGWYDKGPAPGDAGGPPALIVGHIDSYRGPGVFFTLSKIKPGAEVLVTRADGTTAVFVVYRVAQYLKKAYPAKEVYAPTPGAEIRVISCTGEFDYTARSYLSDLVAYASLAPTATATAGSRPAATADHGSPAAPRTGAPGTG